MKDNLTYATADYAKNGKNIGAHNRELKVIRLTESAHEQIKYLFRSPKKF